MAEDHGGAVDVDVGWRGGEFRKVLRVQKKGCGRRIFRMVAQNMSQVAIESLGPEMSLKIRMGLSTRDWTLSVDVGLLYGQSNAGSGELMI